MNHIWVREECRKFSNNVIIGAMVIFSITVTAIYLIARFVH